MEQIWAGTWEQALSSQFLTEFDSNPAMLPSYTGGIWHALVEPRYALTGRYGEDEFRTGAGVQFSRSSNDSLSPSRDSPSLFVDWKHQLETGEFGVSSRYTEVSTRDAGVDATSLLPSISTRTSRFVSGRWRKSFSERSALSADISYETISYSTAAFVDYVTRIGSVTYSYIWTEQATPYAKVSFIDFVPASGSQSTRLDNVALGLNWRSSNTLNGNIQIGNSRVGEEDLGTQGEMSIQYNAERSVYSFRASRQILPGGLGVFETSDQANANWRYELNERSRTGIDYNWRKSHSITSVLNTTTEIWLQNDLNPYWVMRSYYRYNALNGDGISDAYSNILGFSFSYTHSDI